ncbi:MAG: hypothetical protein CMA63_03565 [Euryarchaeota archaeon]|nr:hypothetical protein [Euryarchaeota archaeon]|tara:strand:- start:17492 stop:18160 length:669 start_codon:yes stop_codon:yes gene_type:complete
MDVRTLRSHGWQEVTLESRAHIALFPMAWGMLPLGFAWVMWFTEAYNDLIPWLGAASLFFMLIGGLAGVSSRVGTLNASRVGIGLGTICFGVLVWGLVAEQTVSVGFGLAYTTVSIYLLFKSLDLIFKDGGYVFELPWDPKVRLPADALEDWGVKTTRFSQTTMAMKRFGSNQFVQVYGVVKGEESWLRIDVFGCLNRTELRSLHFGLDLATFQQLALKEEE